MANERLRQAMRDAGLEVADLARHAEVDEKTVRRWINEDRPPYQRNRNTLVKILHRSEQQLWPSLTPARPSTTSLGDLHAIHLHGGTVPDWHQLAAGASTRIELLDLTLATTITTPADAELLAAQARAGAQTRILLSAQDSLFVHQRNTTDPSPTPAQGLARTRQLIDPILSDPAVTLRTFVAAQALSILRFDARMLVTLHLHELQPQPPVILEVFHHADPGLFDRFADHFDSLWNSAT